jgi:hypothetical protein
MPVEITNPYDSALEIYTFESGTEQDQTYDGERVSIAPGETYSFDPGGDFGIVRYPDGKDVGYSDGYIVTEPP